ncbi:hypothetical protein [Streptomyces flaveolus]|uniref:hypothetical protein n=1 Tax=Streptomyces flaveolus TaxID=67297 RepID=UPI00166FDA81|nr:hypothetical protein [Streptomyces flaveolus]GGQ77007.1 hypothetical protein GCM10010216_43780 [Streptomyces flaveolus]
MRAFPRISAVAPTTGLGKLLAARDSGSPASVPASRRRDGQQHSRTAATRARRVTPPVRSLPRRSGY